MSGIKIKTLRIIIPDGVDVKSITEKFEHIAYLYDVRSEWV